MAHESKLSHESKSFRSEVGLRIVSEDPQIRSMLPIDARKVAVLECNPMDPRFDQMHYVLKPSKSPLRPGERLSPGTTIEHERKIYSLREEITGLNLPVLNLYKFEKEGIWYKAGGVRFFVTNTLSSDKKGPTLVVFKDLPPATMMVEDRHALYVTPIIQYYASRQVPLLPSFENDIVVLKERGSTFAPCSQKAKCEQVRAACVLSAPVRPLLIRDLLGLPASLWNRVDPAALYDPALGQFLDAPRVESAVRDITGVLGQPRQGDALGALAGASPTHNRNAISAPLSSLARAPSIPIPSSSAVQFTFGTAQLSPLTSPPGGVGDSVHDGIDRVGVDRWLDEIQQQLALQEGGGGALAPDELSDDFLDDMLDELPDDFLDDESEVTPSPPPHRRPPERGPPPRFEM